MKVKLMAHTQMTHEFVEDSIKAVEDFNNLPNTDGQAVALSAIRTCYSANKPSEIVEKEGHKYFGRKAKEGKGSDADRLIRQIVSSGHTSTLEHITFTFAIEGVSRALLAQLTRHRAGFSYSVQSQRYVKQSSDSRHGGFEFAVPEKVGDERLAEIVFIQQMASAQRAYDELIAQGVPQEDARAVIPQAGTCNLVLTMNLRAALDFYSKRRAGKGAQQEITVLAEMIRKEIVNVEYWTDEFFKAMIEDKRTNKLKSIIDKNSELSDGELATKLLAVLRGEN